MSIEATFNLWTYHPFGKLSNCYLDRPYLSQMNVKNRLEEVLLTNGNDLPSGGHVIPAQSQTPCVLVGYGGTGSGGPGGLSEAIVSWNEILNAPADTYGGFDTEFICMAMKLNGNGFRCFDKPKPPSTKEQAIERYTAEYPPETICAPLKQNSPFQCTRTVEAPMVTRLSLSLASAQAVFALVGILFVAILRKMKKPDQAPSTV